MTHTALPLSRMNKNFSDIIDNYNVITAFLIANAEVKIKMQHSILSNSYLLKIYFLLKFSMIHLASKSAFFLRNLSMELVLPFLNRVRRLHMFYFKFWTCIIPTNY